MSTSFESITSFEILMLLKSCAPVVIAVTAPPPGYLGATPFGIGVVELPEGIRVISRLTESDPALLQSGQPMELQIVALHVDDDGNDVVTYAFAPT